MNSEAGGWPIDGRIAVSMLLTCKSLGKKL